MSLKPANPVWASSAFLEISPLKRITQQYKREFDSAFNNNATPWSSPAPSILHAPLYPHTHAITQLTLTPGSDALFSSSRDGTIRKWKLPNLPCTPPAPTSEELGGPNKLPRAPAPACRRRAALQERASVELPNTPLEATYIISGHSSWINAFVLLDSTCHHDVIASASSDNTIKVWDTYKDFHARVTDQPYRRSMRLRLVVDDVEFFESFISGDVQCLQRPPLTIAPLAELRPPHQDYIQALATSPLDLNKLTSASSDGTLCTYDINAMKLTSAAHIRERLKGLKRAHKQPAINEIHDTPMLYSRVSSTLPHGLWSVTYDQAGLSILTGSSSGEAFLYDTRSESVADAPIKMHDGAVRCLKYINEHTCVSCSSDGTTRMWDTRHWERPLLVLNDHLDSVHSLSLSMENQTITTGGNDGLVFSYRLSDLMGHVTRGTSVLDGVSHGTLVAVHSNPVLALAGNLWTGTASGLISHWTEGSTLVKCHKLTVDLSPSWSEKNKARVSSQSDDNPINAQKWQPESKITDLERRRSCAVGLNLAMSNMRSILPITRQKKVFIGSNQREMLMLGTDNIVTHMDLLTTHIAEFGPEVTFADAKSQLLKREPVAPWCEVDLLLGRPRIQLFDSTFLKGVYNGQEMGTVDFRSPTNLGQLLILKFFKRCISEELMSQVPKSLREQIKREPLSLSAYLISMQGADMKEYITCYANQIPFKSPALHQFLPRQIKTLCQSKQLTMGVLTSTGARLEIIVRGSGRSPSLRNPVIWAALHEPIYQVCSIIGERLKEEQSHKWKKEPAKDITVILVWSEQKICTTWTVGMLALMYFEKWPPPRAPMSLQYKLSGSQPPSSPSPG